MKQATLPARLTPPALATQVWPGKQDYNLMALYQLGAEIVKVDIHRTHPTASSPAPPSPSTIQITDSSISWRHCRHPSCAAAPSIA